MNSLFMLKVIRRKLIAVRGISADPSIQHGGCDQKGIAEFRDGRLVGLILPKDLRYEMKAVLPMQRNVRRQNRPGAAAPVTAKTTDRDPLQNRLSVDPVDAISLIRRVPVDLHLSRSAERTRTGPAGIIGDHFSYANETSIGAPSTEGPPIEV